ncbi:hypothetical protein HC776_00975 [bacterium]|nr:hypothetical protein [bacterium]
MSDLISSRPEWQAVKAQIRAVCIAAARRRETITYSGVIEALDTSLKIGPGMYIFHTLLGQICHEEDSAERGLLCALVVSKATGVPGHGFFKTLIKQRPCMADPHVCWAQERDWLFEYWTSHPDED